MTGSAPNFPSYHLPGPSRGGEERERAQLPAADNLPRLCSHFDFHWAPPLQLSTPKRTTLISLLLSPTATHEHVPVPGVKTFPPSAHVSAAHKSFRVGRGALLTRFPPFPGESRRHDVTQRGRHRLGVAPLLASLRQRSNFLARTACPNSPPFFVLFCSLQFHLFEDVSAGHREAMNLRWRL